MFLNMQEQAGGLPRHWGTWGDPLWGHLSAGPLETALGHRRRQQVAFSPTCLEQDQVLHLWKKRRQLLSQRSDGLGSAERTLTETRRLFVCRALLPALPQVSTELGTVPAAGTRGWLRPCPQVLGEAQTMPNIAFRSCWAGQGRRTAQDWLSLS